MGAPQLDGAIDERFAGVFAALQGLMNASVQYRAAAVFGSVGSGSATRESDCDCLVVVAGEQACSSVMHPTIDGVKLDISFHTLSMIHEMHIQQLQDGERQPMLATARMVFDHDGAFTALCRSARDVQPDRSPPADPAWLQFMLFHADNKVQRAQNQDVGTFGFVMSVNLNEMLKLHFQMQNHWWVSSKMVLPELDRWDPTAASYVRLAAGDSAIVERVHAWETLLSHIADGCGGRQSLEAVRCRCDQCEMHIHALMHGPHPL